VKKRFEMLNAIKPRQKDNKECGGDHETKS